MTVSCYIINAAAAEGEERKQINQDMKTGIEQDIYFIKSILPASYDVKESKKPESIHCVSRIGIRHEDIWKSTFKTIKNHFGDRFQEVYHNTCTNHVDFTIYLK